MKIKNVELKNNIFLAPMAGYTDFAFRHICKKFGAGLTYTEMVSAKGLNYNSEKTKDLLITTEIETPKAIQLFGHCPEDFAKAINNKELEKFDIIDINMGCPAPKIVKNNEGGALLKEIDRAGEIIETCVKSTNKPITVKFRLGFKQNNIVAKEFATMCEQSGASAITIHGRTVDMGYMGVADFSLFKQIKESISIPLIANGDIVDKESFVNVKNCTNADAFMIGRGALGNPFIFGEILGNEIEISKKDVILQHYNMMLQKFDEHYVVTNMRKHMAYYLKGIINNAEKKVLFNTLTDLKSIFEFIETNFE